VADVEIRKAASYRERYGPIVIAGPAIDNPPISKYYTPGFHHIDLINLRQPGVNGNVIYEPSRLNLVDPLRSKQPNWNGNGPDDPPRLKPPQSNAVELAWRE